MNLNCLSRKPRASVSVYRGKRVLEHISAGKNELTPIFPPAGGGPIEVPTQVSLNQGDDQNLEIEPWL